MIRMIHTADLHLDSPFSMLDLQKSEMRRQEMRESFQALINLAHSTNTNLMIIAGDLFDGAFVTHETLNMLVRGFEAIPECRVVIAPGNHDFAGENGVWGKIKFSDNVYVFSSSEIESFDFPEINCTVYGYAFVSNKMERCPINTAVIRDKTRVNILAAHADMLSPISMYAPLNERDLERAGFDYTALGHIHNTDLVKELDCGGFYAYSGCLEGRGFDETGEKGVISARLEKSDGKLAFDSKFIPFSKRIYVKHTLDVTGCENNAAVLAKINECIKSEGFGDKHAVRFILTGLLDPSTRIFTHYIEEQITALFLCKVCDETIPLYKCAYLESDPSIKGAVFDKLRPMLEGADDEQREIASMALRYALVALSGGETTDFT